jgi:ParB family chromosome partitioning protein
VQQRIIEVPLNKLIPSDANVRRTDRSAGVEELASNIAARGGQLIQSLAVRPVRNDAGEETGVYRVPAGGRRLAALKLLAKRRVIAKSTPIPCIVSEDDEDDISLAENVMREPLHPADQFAAFKTLHDRGQGAEDIAARFGVTAQIVRQRLRLAAVSPALMQNYRDGELTLDQLMAFSVSEDHARQEQVFAALASNRPPYLIRRMMTEAEVPARDRRAVFIGAEAYVAAGGSITRDLFLEDGGGWFGDAMLLDQLVMAKLAGLASDVQAGEGWKWAEGRLDYPHDHGLRRVYPIERELPAEDEAQLQTLASAHEGLVAEWEASEEIPEEVELRLDTLRRDIDALAARRLAYTPEEIARAGVFVILSHDGVARIERGFVRPEDEVMVETAAELPQAESKNSEAVITEVAEGPTSKPISDALVRDLTAHRTMALRLCLGEKPEVALIACVHALCLQTFHIAGETCVNVTARSEGLGAHAAGIGESAAAVKLAERHEAWARKLPGDGRALWDFVADLSIEGSLELLAHCVSLTVFGVQEPWDRSARRSSAADVLAKATALDMAAFWGPTEASYFGRVTKSKIVEAVAEAVSEDAARRIEGLTKAAMAEAAENLMTESRWLPSSLRTSEAVAQCE